MSGTEALLLWGPEELLVSEAADELLSQLPEGTEVLTIETEGSEVPGLTEALQAPSLFAAERAVVVGGADRLTKSGVVWLEELVGVGELDVRLLLTAVSSRPPTALMKAVEGFGQVHRLSAPRRKELPAWVARRLKGAGVEADRDAAAVLVESVGEDLRALAQAVDQLATRAGRGGAVTADVVRTHFPGSADRPVWALFDAMIAGRGPEAMRVLHQVLAQGDDPIAILFALVSQVRYVMRARSLLDRSGALSEADLAGALGVSRGRAAVLKRQAGRLSWEWLTDAYRALADADVELKGGEDGAALPPEIVLERVVAGATAAA